MAITTQSELQAAIGNWLDHSFLHISHARVHRVVRDGLKSPLARARAGSLGHARAVVGRGGAADGLSDVATPDVDRLDSSATRAAAPARCG
jgi:hypothetical protein